MRNFQRNGVRVLLGSVACCLAILSFPGLSRGANVHRSTKRPPEARLRLFDLHTNRSINVVFRRNGHYVPKSLARLDRFLRDRRTGEIHHYDPRVFDLLAALMARIGRPGGEIDVICGYRSHWSNEYLRRHTSGVARHSLHIKAEAIDIRVPGLATAALRDAALALHRGGVGYYPRSHFVHVDVGRVRRWSLMN